MTECDEVAATMVEGAPDFKTMDETRTYVRERMPDSSPQVIDNVAWTLKALANKAHLGTCPACNGSTRRPVPPEEECYKNNLATYDAATNTLACDNCGGATMALHATGKVKRRPDGTPCLHTYEGANIGRCLNRYTCVHCGDQHTID